MILTFVINYFKMCKGHKTECPICFDDKYCISLECGHSFCEECLYSWMEHFDPLNDNFTCPMCRGEVSNFDNEELNSQLEELHSRIEIRKEEEDGYYGMNIYITYCIYYFPPDQNIHNYPKNMKFYTYEELI